MKDLDSIKYGTNILFRVGSLSYEGRVLEVDTFDGIRAYRVAILAPGGGPPTGEERDIHDGQIQRVFI